MSGSVLSSVRSSIISRASVEQTRGEWRRSGAGMTYPRYEGVASEYRSCKPLPVCTEWTEAP